jgi:hypothetical protein
LQLSGSNFLKFFVLSKEEKLEQLLKALSDKYLINFILGKIGKTKFDLANARRGVSKKGLDEMIGLIQREFESDLHNSGEAAMLEKNNRQLLLEITEKMDKVMALLQSRES